MELVKETIEFVKKELENAESEKGRNKKVYIF